MKKNKMEENSNESQELRGEKDAVVKRLQDLTVAFVRLKQAREVTVKKMTAYEKKVKELEIENEKIAEEIKLSREERRIMLNELEESR